jgi:hypothetical protein
MFFPQGIHRKVGSRSPAQLYRAGGSITLWMTACSFELGDVLENVNPQYRKSFGSGRMGFSSDRREHSPTFLFSGIMALKIHLPGPPNLV